MMRKVYEVYFRPRQPMDEISRERLRRSFRKSGNELLISGLLVILMHSVAFATGRIIFTTFALRSGVSLWFFLLGIWCRIRAKALSKPRSSA